MANSNRSAGAKTAPLPKPKKPYKDFPLTPHASGKWQKKILGKIHYFGKWAKREKGKLVRIPGDGWKEALELYKAQADDLHAGRVPRARKAGAAKVKDLCNDFLNSKEALLNSGELSARSFKDYKATTDRMVVEFGKDRLLEDLQPEDFAKLRAKLAAKWGPTRLGNEINRIRVVCKFAFDTRLVPTPIHYGIEFRRPSKAVMRKHRAKTGSKLFSAKEVRTLLEHSEGQVRAMVLLGINCAMGNSDVGTLPRSVVDLDSAWIEYPRPKTGVERNAALWPETVEALRAVMEKRDNDTLVFRTKYGRAWADEGVSDAVSQEFGKLLRATNLSKTGRGFYSLRHTFRTVADSTRDFPAVRLVMGHSDSSIDAVYREHIDPERIRAVSDHVREWLFSTDTKGE